MTLALVTSLLPVLTSPPFGGTNRSNISRNQVAIMPDQRIPVGVLPLLFEVFHDHVNETLV